MSESAHEPVWSDLQVSCLQAMGHTVYLDRDSADALPAPIAGVEHAPAPAPVREQRIAQAAPAVAPPVRRTAPAAPAESRAPGTGSAAAPQRRSRVGLPDRLQMALLRASGCDPGDPTTQALMASWPLAELRGNPSAKRALWPQLRALRRRQDPA